MNRSSGSDATELKTEPLQFAAIQPLAETKQAPMPQELELLWLDKQLTGPGEKYDVFFVVVVFVDIPESIGSKPTADTKQK